MDSALWAVTSYFNPAGYRRRLENFRVFRSRLEMPLLAVEWSATGRFELEPGKDADVLIQLDGGDVMWQKERLLNIGIARLPAQCTHVAWLDCDVVFERRDLAESILAELRSATIVHLYDRVAYLAPGACVSDPRSRSWHGGDVTLERHGAAAARAAMPAPETSSPVATESLDDFRRMPSLGFAWAAARTLLERHPLFDTWVVGGGDSAFYFAAIGEPERVVANHSLSPAHRDCYLPRARALADAVAGKVGFVAGRMFSLWHGSFEDRHYRSRHSILSRYDYDPRRFLRRAATDVWEWAEVPEGLPADVRAYFDSRKEDGRDSGIRVPR